MIETERTRLRRLTSSDLAFMSELESDAEVTRYIPRRIPQTIEQTRARFEEFLAKPMPQSPLGVWAVESKESSKLVGWFMLIESEGHALELGYMIPRREWGKGFATEVGRMLLQLALKMNPGRKVIASTDPENLPSIRVLEKLGFQEVETKRRHDPVLNKEIELKVFALCS